MARIEMESSPINTITQGTVITGDIKANGDFRLDGRLEGNIVLNGRLVIGEQGVVQGDVVCQNADIYGSVQGNTSVKEQLSLRTSAKLKGDILINKLSIEPGATFSGSCRMIDEVRQESTVSTNAEEQ